MVIVKIHGGLGNQMFQYSFGLWLQDVLDEDVRFDESWYRGVNRDVAKQTQRDLELDIFNLTYQRTDWWDNLLLYGELGSFRVPAVAKLLRRIMRPSIMRLSDADIDDKIHLSNKYKHFAGYWQDLKYLDSQRDRLVEVFRFPELEYEENRKLAMDIQRGNSVGVHVRRGDYLTHGQGHHAVCDKDYYYSAFRIFREKLEDVNFFIFSDDIAWCRAQFSNEDVRFIDWNNDAPPHVDMQLMSMCDHNIIANSTYSWWAAWLNTNPNKTIVSPLNWFANPVKNGRALDIVPPGWIKI